MAVSITSNLDLAQLLSKRPSGEPANSSKNSAKVGSESDPQWNGVQQADHNGSAHSEHSFSTALHDALVKTHTNDSQTVNGKTKASDLSQAASSNLSDTQPVKLPAQSDLTLTGSSSSQDLLALVLSSQKIAPSKSTKNSDDSDKVQPQSASDASQAIALAYLTLTTPAQSAPLAPVAVDPAAVKAGDVNFSASVIPNQSLAATTAAASAAAPGASAESPNISTATESIVFDGHLTATAKHDAAAPSAPIQPAAASSSDAKPLLPGQPAAQPAPAPSPQIGHSARKAQ